MSAVVEETAYRGQRALRLHAGSMSATFLPELGLTGVSLRHADGEYLTVPGGLDAMREGRTTGFPFVGPWVNRLGAFEYRSGRTRVDVAPAVAAEQVRTDGNGLPIHGFLSGRSVWTIARTSARGDVARLRATIDVEGEAFPFRHRLEVTISARPDRLEIDTTVVATGRRDVPFVFGWHPYLVVPGTPRSRWRLRTPHWRHLELDARSIPNGSSSMEPATDAPLGRRTFDDLYALTHGATGAASRVALSGEDGRSVTLRCGPGYGHAQIWVPAGKTYASLEPMAAATNALVTGAAPLVPPGESRTATFALEFTAPAA